MASMCLQLHKRKQIWRQDKKQTNRRSREFYLQWKWKEERAGAPVCPLLCCQKFDGGHFE